MGQKVLYCNVIYINEKKKRNEGKRERTKGRRYTLLKEGYWDHLTHHKKNPLRSIGYGGDKNYW